MDRNLFNLNNICSYDHIYNLMILTKIKKFKNCSYICNTNNNFWFIYHNNILYSGILNDNKILFDSKWFKINNIYIFIQRVDYFTRYIKFYNKKDFYIEYYFYKNFDLIEKIIKKNGICLYNFIIEENKIVSSINYNLTYKNNKIFFVKKKSIRNIQSITIMFYKLLI